MTDETEVLRIKREALEDLAREMECRWSPVSGCSNEQVARAVRGVAARDYPPPAPRKVRGEVKCEFGLWQLHGHNWQWAPYEYSESWYQPVHVLEAEAMVREQARADANGMVEEGLGAASPKSECQAGEVASTHVASPTDHSDSPAPSPAPAETREWWLVLSNHDLRPLCVYPTQERASRVAVELLGSGCDAQSFPVVPRASLEATEAARRTDVATIQATADALYGDNNRPPAWQSGMPGAVGAMREERDQFQKAYDAAERHNTILRENVERHGDTIRDLRAQLREATEPVSRETVERMRDEYERSFWYHNEASSIAMSKALAVLGLTVEGA